MYILARTGPLEKSEDKVYYVKAPALERKYEDAGYQRCERAYKIIRGHSEYTVYCPEFRYGEKGIEPIVVIAEFHIPGRPYPLEIYLYAIDLYSSAPEKGQRWAAGETRRRFDLKTFAHTTLGRALKALVNMLDEVKEAAAIKRQPESDECAGETKQASFATVNSTAGMRERAAQFLHGATARAGQLGIDAYHRIAREWFSEHRRLLL